MAATLAEQQLDRRLLDLLARMGWRAEGDGLISGQPPAAPIRAGVPRFVPDDGFAESFGYQWNAFDVRQKEEDETTFEVKTGVRLDQLAGMTVLDAGCGGGRYCRVAGERADFVVGVDRSHAVDKARQLCDGLSNVSFLQADLVDLPLPEASFDLVFSVGVLHHSPSTFASLQSIARRVKPGGRLSVWLYRRNTFWQEWLNDAARAVAHRMSRRTLLGFCKIGAVVGGIPGLRSTLNKILNFSSHPVWELRVCDTFDWYSPQYQHHHTVAETTGWFDQLGFTDIAELPPAKTGRLYRFAWRHGWLIGSGVNITGVRNSTL